MQYNTMRTVKQNDASWQMQPSTYVLVTLICGQPVNRFFRKMYP